MPFLRVDAYEGRSKEQVKELLDANPPAILSAFGVLYVTVPGSIRSTPDRTSSFRTPDSVSIAQECCLHRESQADNEPRHRRETSIQSSLKN